MCGRYVLDTDDKELAREFDAIVEKIQEENAADQELIKKRYNVAPTQIVPIVYQFKQERSLSGAKWGLVPSWSKDAAIGNRMINARAETLTEKPSFRNAFRSRRCIIPASGFYEWQHSATGRGAKQPFYFYLTEKPVFGFAGLWEEWTDKTTGERLETCAIITTSANQVLAPVHDRMPAILHERVYEQWLDPTNNQTDELKKLLVPFSDDLMAAHPVSRQINNPAFNERGLIDPIELNSK